MPATSTPRDLLMTGAVFGAAAFVWSGWAQEEPPEGVAWPVVLGLLSVLGLGLAGWSATRAVRAWGSGTALTPGSRAFRRYLVAFWGEVAVAAAAGVVLAQAGRSDLLAPFVLLVVGLHFLALAGVFGQPVLHLAAVLLSTVAVVAAVVPAPVAAHSFWCGVAGAPVFLAIGLWCSRAGSSALSSG